MNFFFLSNSFLPLAVMVCCDAKMLHRWSATQLTSSVVAAQQAVGEGVKLPHTCPRQRDAVPGHAPRPRPLLHPSCCSDGFRRVFGRLRPSEQRQHQEETAARCQSWGAPLDVYRWEETANSFLPASQFSLFIPSRGHHHHTPYCVCFLIALQHHEAMKN